MTERPDVPSPPRDPAGQPAAQERLASAMNEVAGLLMDTESFQTVMQELSRLAVRLVDGVRTAGVTVSNGGRIITVASADALAMLLDEQQYELDEGPCLESMRRALITEVPDMAEETRWGGYPATAVSLGIRSTFSSPLVVRGEPIGVLNLYADRPGAFAPTDVREAVQHLATMSVMTITATLRNYGDMTLTDQLQQALSTRSVIDQAIGIVIATQRCTPDEAFAILRGASQVRNIRLNQIAQDLIDRTVTAG